MSVGLNFEDFETRKMLPLTPLSFPKGLQIADHLEFISDGGGGGEKKRKGGGGHTVISIVTLLYKI